MDFLIHYYLGHMLVECRSRISVDKSLNEIIPSSMKDRRCSYGMEAITYVFPFSLCAVQ